MQDRLKKVRKLLSEQSLDAVLISSLPNIIYLSDYNGFVPDERDAYVVITRNEAYILTNLLYAEAMPKAVPHLKLIEITRDNPLKKAFADLISKHSLKSIGYEESNLTVQEFGQLNSLSAKLTPANLHFLRIEKDTEELAFLQKACEITDDAFAFIQTKIKPEVTEIEIANLLNLYFVGHNAESSFRAVVAFGANSSVPHHLSGQKKLKKDDIILIDFGAKYHNYCADMTRTFFMGKATKKQKEIHQLVYETQIYVQELIKVKLQKHEPVSSFELDAAARKFIADRHYPPFPYSLGHGIGLEVHEMPLLNPRHDDPIGNDTVFTLEPGIHLPGEIGVRIEDMFLIQNNALHQLTHSRAELIEL